MFLQNVGLEHQPSRSNISTLSTQLGIEKSGRADLEGIISTQQDVIFELTSKVQKTEERNACLEKKMEALARITGQQRPALITNITR